jgi:hypothetical protein
VGVHLNEDQGKRSRTKEQREYDKAPDRAYQSATKKIPEQSKPESFNRNPSRAGRGPLNLTSAQFVSI